MYATSEHPSSSLLIARRSGPVARTAAAALVAAALAPGCLWHGRHLADPQPAEKAPEPSFDAPPEASPVTLPAGARVLTPPGWVAVENDEFALKLVPEHPSGPSRSAPASLPWGEHFISVDVPELPAFRIPGYLPMRLIRSGYIDHLKKQAPRATVQDLGSPRIPGAGTALVRTVWPEDAPTHMETALLLTHADRVYILRGRSPIQEEPATRAAFDEVAASLSWSE